MMKKFLTVVGVVAGMLAATSINAFELAGEPVQVDESVTTPYWQPKVATSGRDSIWAACRAAEAADYHVCLREFVLSANPDLFPIHKIKDGTWSDADAELRKGVTYMVPVLPAKQVTVAVADQSVPQVADWSVFWEQALDQPSFKDALESAVAAAFEGETFADMLTTAVGVSIADDPRFQVMEEQVATNASQLTEHGDRLGMVESDIVEQASALASLAAGQERQDAEIQHLRDMQLQQAAQLTELMRLLPSTPPSDHVARLAAESTPALN